MILGAAYMLWLYRRVIFGALTKEDLKLIKDMRLNEILRLRAAGRAASSSMGIYPSFFLDPMDASVEQPGRPDRRTGARRTSSRCCT